MPWLLEGVGIHMPKSRGLQHMVSRRSVSTTAPLKGIHVATTPRAIFLFHQRILQGSLKEPPFSLRWSWVVSLWRSLVSTLPHQCVVTNLVAKDWCPPDTKREGKISSFGQPSSRPTLTWQWDAATRVGCPTCSAPTQKIVSCLAAYAVQEMHYLSCGRGDGVEPSTHMSRGVYCNCNTGSLAANLVKWTSSRWPTWYLGDKWSYEWGLGEKGALAMTFDIVHWIAKQVCLFVCLLIFFCILYFWILSNVFVLGIISHKLFPPWFLKGCSDSSWNRLEVSREHGLRSPWDRQWSPWGSQWLLGKITIRKSNSVQVIPEVRSCLLVPYIL